MRGEVLADEANGCRGCVMGSREGRVRTVAVTLGEMQNHEWI